MCILLLPPLLACASLGAAQPPVETLPEGAERSYWVSLTLSATDRGYWTQDPSVPAPQLPSEEEIANAARVLRSEYGANRLYLVYHRQCAEEDARRLFGWWSEADADLEVVPTFLPMDYSHGLQAGAPVFSSVELTAWGAWCEERLHAPAVALYDVYPNRPWDWAIEALRWGCDLPIGQVGIQPTETPREGLSFVVVDTWGGVSAYRSNDDWNAKGAGLLREWAAFPRPDVRAVFDLIAVAWDYDYSADGGAAPPYDDERDDPLPEGRNTLAARAIAEACPEGTFGGCSSDLLILQNHTLAHGEDLYADLRQGRRYTGMFAGPLDEIARVYQTSR